MVIFNDFTSFLNKAIVVQMVQKMSNDNKEALDMLEVQNQEFLEAQREIDATFVQSMRDVLAEDRAETQRFMRVFFNSN